MTEFFKLNHIDLGFANHPTEGTIFTKGALDTEVLIRKGKLRINLLTPSLELTDELHNGLLADPFFDDKRHVDYIRLMSYYDLAVPNGMSAIPARILIRLTNPFSICPSILYRNNNSKNNCLKSPNSPSLKI